MITVLVAEDEQPLREAICALITAEPEMEVVGAADDADQARQLAQMHAPDVALVDVRMPGGGAQATREIRQHSAKTRVVALSAYEDHATVLGMLRSGAVGYLVKGISPPEIVEAIRRAARGQASLSVEVISALIAELTRDLAGRQATEHVLRQSEERFRGLVESFPDATVIASENGAILLVNALTEELFGYARQDLVGKPVELLLPDALLEQLVSHRAGVDPITRLMGAQRPLSGRRRDGSDFRADISSSGIDEWRLITIRVSESKEKQVKEMHGEGRFAALLECAPDAVAISDDAGTIVLVNAQTERLFGYTRRELLGMPVEMLLPERFRDRHVEHRSDYLADPRTRSMGCGLELAGRRKNGSEFPVDISLSMIETEEGRLCTAFVRDVTDRQAQAALEQDLAERRALLAHLVSAGEEERRRIAEDIHDDSIQVITAAGMRLQILRRRLDDPEHLALLADLQEMIELSISRLRHLLFELRPPVLDNEGLSAALEMCLNEAGEATPVRYLLEDRLRSQPGAETRVILYRITQEALTNIRKHAEAKNVTVSLREHEGGYLVRVVDDGVGFRVARTTPVPGHFGVAAMRERATLAGGWLRVESSPGHGTTIEVWMPALPAPAANQRIHADGSAS